MIYNDPALFAGKKEEALIYQIWGLADWEAFVAESADLPSNCRVELMDDINCGGAAYDALAFAGDFNGNNHTISNATFDAVDGNSGMFSVIGSGQIIANLTLSAITVNGGAYAGALVGAVSPDALIQNIQVRNSAIQSIHAAGVVGIANGAIVQFCSSRDTQITGQFTAAGVVGVNNYAAVKHCYSTCTPTAVGGAIGGVIGRKANGGYAEYCWATMIVVGTSDGSGTDIALLVVNQHTSEDDFVDAGFNAEGAEYWVLEEGISTHFDISAVTYSF